MRCWVSEKSGSLRDRKKARSIPRRSRQKNETTASTVPVCIAASKESPNRSWSNPRKYCPRSKCPELETGRNSVSPCTMPKNIAPISSNTTRCSSLLLRTRPRSLPASEPYARVF
jgi:hypothetical protein